MKLDVTIDLSEVQKMLSDMPNTVRTAARNTLNDGAFFARDRVYDKMREKLSKLVPEAQIQTAHGQMPEELLEQVMVDFYEGKDLVDENGDFTKNPIVRDIEALHLFTTNLNSLDATQRLKLNKDGVVVFNFGKYVDQSVIDIFKKEKGYYNWMMSKDFSQQVKNIITKIYQEEIIGKL